MKFKTRIPSKIYINISLFYTLFVFAICYTITSPVLIELAKDINCSVKNIGLIFSFYFCGFVLACLLSNWLINFFKRKILLSIFNFTLFAAIFSMSFASNFAYVVVVYFILGISGGFLEPQISILIIDTNKKSEGLYVCLSQVFFCIGALVGPLISVVITKIGLDFKCAYIVAGVLCFINFIFFLFIDMSTLENKKTEDLANIRNMAKIKNRSIFVLLSAIMFFYVCAEIGLVTWIPLFLRLNKFFNRLLAGQVLSFFWFATIVGRIFTGFLTKKIKILKILVSMTCLSIVTIIVGIYSKNDTTTVISFILAGFFIAGIWPLIVTEGGLKYPQNRNFAISILVLSGGAGGLLAPIILSLIYRSFNLFIVMNTNYIFLILLIIPLTILFMISKRFKVQ